MMCLYIRFIISTKYIGLIADFLSFGFQGMVVLPTHDFGDELGRYAMLVDCNYNEFEVLVERNNGRIYPTTGWHALKDFFNVPVGSWVSMVYVGCRGNLK